MGSKLDMTVDAVTSDIQTAVYPRPRPGPDCHVMHRDDAASALGEIERDRAWRRERVSTAAYYLSERRGFAPDNQEDDWVLAESQIDALDELDE